MHHCTSLSAIVNMIAAFIFNFKVFRKYMDMYATYMHRARLHQLTHQPDIHLHRSTSEPAYSLRGKQLR